MVGVVLRENGRLEFYSDFMQVDEHFDPAALCVDIQTDSDLFCLRFAGQPDPEGKGIHDTFKKIPHQWRNRIGLATSRDIKRGYDKWPVVIHRRIARYFKLYSSIANFQLFQIIAHRKMISIYDYHKKAFMPTHEKFGEYIRAVDVKKLDAAKRSAYARTKTLGDGQEAVQEHQKKHKNELKQFELIVQYGAQSFAYVQVKKNGSLVQNDPKKIDGRVLKSYDD